MNMKRYISTMVFLFISAIILCGQNKVYWVHGLNDNSSTWNTYKYALIPDAYQGTSITWDSDYPLSAAADTLNRFINAQVTSGKKAIVFGHSAGGLVARGAARSNGKIRAVITAGTPNNGAGIVTSLHNRSFNNVASKAISIVSKCIKTSTSVLCSYPNLLSGIAAIINRSANLLADIGSGLAENKINEIKRDYSSQAAEDMNPNLNRNFLKKLNSTAPTIPIINLYGNEDEKRLVRIAGTALHKTENDYNTTDNCYDETAYTYYNKAINTCSTCETIHHSAAVTNGVRAIFLRPDLWISCSLNSSASSAWGDARRFIEYDIHNEWDRIIGAVHTDRIEHWHRFLWWKWCNVEYVTVYEDSDGFIPNSSSKMDEGKGPNTRNYEIKGVNHLEMNSHTEMRKRLYSILNNGAYGEEFDYKN